jgi:hypothetical protein
VAVLAPVMVVVSGHRGHQHVHAAGGAATDGLGYEQAHSGEGDADGERHGGLRDVKVHAFRRNDLSVR